MWRCLAVALVLCGCQDVYSTLPGEPGDGGPLTTSGTTGTGGKHNPDGGGNADLAVPPTLGLIVAHSSTSSFVSVSLGSDGCTRTAVQGCTLIECPPADMAVAGTVANLGQIAITGGLAPIQISPQSDGRYLTQSSTGPLWSANGAELTVSATGGDYAAFSTIIEAPSAVTLTLPLAQSQLDLPRAADFDVSWTGGTSGVVTVAVNVGASELRCDFLRINDSGTVSHLALSRLPAGSGTVAISDTARAVAGSGIDLTVETPALDSNGAPFIVPANVH